MSFSVNFRTVLVAPVTAITLALSVAACGGSDAPVAQVEEAGVPGMSADNARLVLPPVAGNPAAIYFDLAYDGDRNLAIRGASVAGAESAMLHDYGEFEGKKQMMEAIDIVVRKGDKLKFEPGTRHVMAFGLPEDLAAGDSVDVSVRVSGGKEFTFPAEVRAAGEER